MAASARLPKADVSCSTVMPRFSHSTENITHPCAEGALVGTHLKLRFLIAGRRHPDELG
jgi:hypothetical protein